MDIETEFFDRLSRSRSQRDQHLAIQAVTLSEVGDEAALRLADVYFETRNDAFYDGEIHLARARTFGGLGRVEQALKAFTASLDWQSQNTNHDIGVKLEFAFFIASKLLSAEYEAAREALRKSKPNAFSEAATLRRLVARAILETGETARRSANWALRHVGSCGNREGLSKRLLWNLCRVAGFSRYQALGYVWRNRR